MPTGKFPPVILRGQGHFRLLEERHFHDDAAHLVFPMSGFPADLIQKEGVLEKGFHFISKPSSPHDLLQKVREVLDQPT